VIREPRSTGASVKARVTADGADGATRPGAGAACTRVGCAAAGAAAHPAAPQRAARRAIPRRKDYFLRARDFFLGALAFLVRARGVISASSGHTPGGQTHSIECGL